MKSLGGWHWKKNYVPPHIQKKRKHLVNIIRVAQTNPDREGDVTRFKTEPVCLVTGDGKTLPNDVAEFESWGIPHDVYCVNRSMLFFQRQIDHWCAIDVEESVWFTQNVNEKIQNVKPIIRHTIGEGSFAYDVYWTMVGDIENDFQRRVLTGNSGYFAVLTALEMGYEKLVLAGIPLNMEPCWYEPESDEGPNWNGWCYTQWMDFKMKRPEAENVKSLSGYSKFILGEATREWACHF